MAPNPKVNLDDKVDDGEMDLSMLNLQEVPVKEIASYRKVWNLDLSNNHLTQLTKQFPTLTNLTKIDLSKNKLKKLPDNFGDLHRLKHLDLYRNELQHLPLSFGQLKNLKWLDLKDNPLVPAIQEAAGECLDAAQCQVCATNMIYFFTKLKEKVDEEREIREKQRLKEKEKQKEIELAAQKSSHSLNEKKKKKDIKAKSQTKLKVENDVTSKTSTLKKPKPKIQLDNKHGRPFFFYLFAGFLFFSCILFILTAAQFEKTLIIEEIIHSSWKNTLAKCPESVQQVGNVFGQYFYAFHQQVSSLFVKSQDTSYYKYLAHKFNTLYDNFIL